MTQAKYANVALGIPKGPFTYRIPPEKLAHIQKGSRVLVPFHQFTKIGYVTEVLQSTDLKNIKAVEVVFDEEPILSKTLFQLTYWMSDYYQCSLGEAMENALPKLIRKGRKLKDTDEEMVTLESPSKIHFDHELTGEQRQVFESILQAETKKKFLLKGVTGSGKTEIYLRLIVETLKQGKSTICMVPEIALTVHLTNYFKKYLGDHLEILHSKLTDVERYKAWSRIKRGETKVVLGARSSLFSPVQDLGLIIMDEEHETTYKQAEVPRYHVREVAEKLSEIENAIFSHGNGNTITRGEIRL